MIQIFYSRHSPLFERLAILATTAACFGMTWMVASALTWIQRPEVLYVTAFLILQTGLVIVVTLVLLIFKLALNRSEEMRARRLLPFEDLVAGLVTAAEDPAELLNLAEEYPRDFFRVVGKSLDLLEGSARQRVTEVAVQTSAYQKLLAESARSNPNRAIKGVLMLGKLNAKGASAAIEDALNHPIRLVRLAAQEALVRTQGEAAQRRMLECSHELAPWERVRVFHYLPAQSQLLSPFVTAAIESGQEDRIVAALELVLNRQTLVSVSQVKQLAESGSAEVRIKFFRALGFFAIEADIDPILRKGLRDADWRVRAMAARACLHFRSSGASGELLRIAQESNNFAEVRHAVRALWVICGEAFEDRQGPALSRNEMAARVVAEVMEKEVLSSGRDA